MNNTLRVKNGVIWSSIDKIAYSAGQLCINLVIARLILPSEYALVAMIAIFIAIGQTFVDSGFSQAIIHKQDRSPLDLSTVFYFNIGVALIIYILIYFLAPIIADFYDNEIFIPLTRVVALNIIISSFTIVQRAILTIKVDFRTQAVISVISILISGVASIWMALNGYGVWSMVAQTLIVHGVTCVLLWIIVKWRPLDKFSVDSFKTLFSYGSKLLASRLINTICQNLYTLAIGKVYSPNQVAYFNNANQLSLYSACYLNEIISRALFPILCEMQSEKEKLMQFYYKLLSLSSYIIFPIMIGLIVLAKPFILVVLNDRWIDSIPYMQIIALAYMWYPLMGLNQLFNILGRTDLYLKSEIIKKVLFAVILTITLFMSVKAICWGILVYNLTEIVVNMVLLKPIINITYKKTLLSVIPSILLSVGMAVIIICIIQFINSDLLKLVSGICVGVCVYYLLSKMSKSDNLVALEKIIKTKS